MSVDDHSVWTGEALRRSLETAAGAPAGEGDAILAADSWLVVDGRVRAIALHRDRFFSAVAATGWTDGPGSDDELAAFWEAAVAALPRQGEVFPRVELAQTAEGPRLRLLIRAAPERSRSVVVATAADGDTRQHPTVKGPDLTRMAAAREGVATLGAGEAVILTPDGFVVEGAYSGLLWWRGSILCGPLDVFERVDSVTVRSVLALATALGIETYQEAVTPAELDGTELWALSALHGARIVTGWVDGPALAELPGRLATWQARLGALRQPL
jgi:branched-subunit amino acid aminotransferase/4-amino-4-deoxychorismate lyase